ncbi:MAG: NADH dehydrogenase subunit [Proteobacteria bacterium]|nr:NADH dehydrogenase subunit [Pseudomonadota bacterium]
MSEKMVKLTINDKVVEVPAGTSVFTAAAMAGIEIPHYCYHPDLSVAGVCRMCMVEIEKNPRLQISCNTPATEGMVVKTKTDKVKETVKNVLELHLINHPLDCPICDKAGECKLQDFYAGYGLYESRMDYEKVHKPKVQDIGTIVLDSERCILCSRCVRFTSEVTKTNELGIFNRGDRAVLGTVDNKPLKNDYTGNLADICPVGALTAKDFRFKQRVWFLDKTKTVCTLCAHGCNTVVSRNPQTQKLFRVEPRRNPEINKSWICDRGRWDFHYVHDDNRIPEPKRFLDGKWTEQTWHGAFQTLGEEITQDPSSVLVALSTQMTNEEISDVVNTLLSLGVKEFTWVVDESVVSETQPFDGILKHRDLTPNARGFEVAMKSINMSWMRAAQAVEKLKTKRFTRLLVLGLEGYEMPGLANLLLAVPVETKVALHATSQTAFLEKCDWILPNVSAFEKSGTLVNAQGISQALKASVPKQFLSRDGHQVAWGLSQKSDRKPLSVRGAKV